MIKQGFQIGQAVGGGDCFFDSISKALKQLKPEIDFTVKSLRGVCKRFAQSQIENNLSWLREGLKNEAEQINVYVKHIEFSADDIEQKPETINEKELTSPIWGRSEIEGRIICKEYNVKLHIREKHTVEGKEVWLDQIMDSKGSSSVNDVDYNDQNVIHILNEGNAHFMPLLRPQESQQNEQKFLDPSDYDDGQVCFDEELICVVRNNNLQEEEKLEKIKDLLKKGAHVNFEDANNKNNTPLHIAVYKKELKIIKLLVKNGAKIDVKNNVNKSPLDIANHFKRPDIVLILESSIQLSQASTGAQSVSRQQFQQNLPSESSKYQIYSIRSSQNQDKHTFSKRKGATGIDGYLYEMDLLILSKLRGERDTDKFYLATNVNGVGAFDDVVIRYWSSDSEKKKSKIILLQAKHAENPRKNKITIEKFKNPKCDDGKFYLGKYFKNYLKIREKFEDKETDPVFKGNFRELDVKCIIYTNSIIDEHFDKNRKVDVDGNILSTKFKNNKGEAFKFSLDAKNFDLIKQLMIISCQERIKLLAKALVSCIYSELKCIDMMNNELLLTYHVFLSRNVIEIKEEKKNDQNGNEYREGKINHNFLKNKDQFVKKLKEEVLYEYADNVVFIEKCISDLSNKSIRDDLVNKIAESLNFSKEVDVDIIEKLGGSAFTFDTKSKKFKFTAQNKLRDESAKKFIEELENKVDDLTDYKFEFPCRLIEKALKNQLFMFPVTFGNFSPCIKKPEHLIRQLIKLCKQYKFQKVIKIDDSMVGNGKILTVGDIKNIGKLVGNLLVFDQNEKMLRLANEKSLDGSVLRLSKEFKTTAESDGLELDDYRFDIKVKKFPRNSLVNEGEDRENVEEFLSKLEIFTGQASDTELKKIIKNEIRDLYHLTRDEVEENYLRIKHKAGTFWKEGDYYLTKNDDLFTNILRLNIQFDIAGPEVLFTGRDKELEDLHKILQGGSKASVIGLGGIGKSELARKYISEYINSYDGNLIWINAKNHHSLTESFKRLALNKLEITMKDSYNNEIDMKLIVEDVYRFFARRNSLFIFDDAEEYKDIKEFLPHFLHPNNKRPKVLITSRNKNWMVKGVKVIYLEEFKEDEAEKFIEDFLEIKKDSHKEDVKKLMKELHCFPLALRQAVAYIKQEDIKLNKRGSKEFKISNYLEKRQQEENKLLDYYYENSNFYTKTVLTTWNTTLEKIAVDKMYGRQAIDILNIMAYFVPNKIEIRGLFTMVETDERWKAVELLDRYSMINLKNGLVDIHSLVQEVTRQKLKMENKEKEVLKRALKGIDNFNISDEGLSHIISVWDYSIRYSELISEFCTSSQYGNNNDTPIHLLTGSGNEVGMHRILKILPEMKDVCNKCGDTPLCNAIFKGYKNIIKSLIEDYNVDPKHYVSANHHKPITLAALHGDEDLVKYFVSKGADVNSQISEDFTTLSFAAVSGNRSLVKYLIDEGAEVNNLSPLTSVLHQAILLAKEHGTCENDVLEIINFCLEKDHDLMKRVDIAGRTLLHVAVTAGFRNIVEMCLDEGLDVNAKCNRYAIPGFRNMVANYTALHIAAQNNNREIVEILIKNKACYDVKNAEGKTPLDLAKPESDVYNLLSYIDHLFKAIEDGKENDVYSLLRDKNDNEFKTILNAENTHGKKLIQVAGRKGEKGIVKLLLEKLTSNTKDISQ